MQSQALQFWLQDNLLDYQPMKNREKLDAREQERLNFLIG